MYRRFLSVRYFRTRLVNWLSVVGVMVGVAVMIVVWSVFTGFSTETKRVIRGTLADVELSPTGPDQPPDYPELERMLQRSPDVVACVPRLTAYVAHPYESTRRVSGTGTGYHFMTGVGVDWRREQRFVEDSRRRGLRDVSGLVNLVVAAEDPRDPFSSPSSLARWGPDGDAETLKGMFSFTFLKRFIGLPPGVKEEPASYLARKVPLTIVRETTDADGNPDYKISSKEVVVSAVYDSKERDVDVARVYFDRGTLWKFSAPLPPPPPGGGRAPKPPDTPPEKVPYSEVSISVPDYQRVEQSKQAIVGWCADHGVAGMSGASWQDQRGSILMAVNNEKMLLAIVIAFIGLLAGFTILATLTLTVIEKTRDIGVLLALGATARGVMTVFLLSGVLIGLLGGLLGVLLGIGLTRALNPFRDWLRSATGIDLFPPDVYGFEEIPYLFDVPAMLWITGGCMAVAFLASLLPSLRAARLDPVVALRHE